MSFPQSCNEQLRIAVFTRHFGKHFGGAEHYSVAVVEQLARQHEVHVFAQQIEHRMSGVHYHRISTPLLKPRWLNQLWYAAVTWWRTRRGFDVVYSHENTWHGDIQTIHVRPFKSGLFHERMGMRRWLQWVKLYTSPRLLTYWWLEHARMRVRPGRSIVATSEAVKQDILKSYPHVASILHIITPGVTLPQQEPVDHPVMQLEMRRELGLPQDVMLALFVGNDYIKKGLPTLLQALAKVPDLHLAVVGRTTHLASCQQQTQSLGLTDRVHFLGSLQDVAPAYRAADLLVHPTTEDTYAMVVLEAMAYGLPVVVSNAPFCGIAADLSNEQQALILSNPRDPQVLAQHLRCLLVDLQLQNHLQASGRQFASAHSWQAVAKQHEVLLLQITHEL